MKGKADMLKYVMHFLFFTFNEFSFLLKSVVYQLLPLTKSGNLHKIMKFSPYMTLTCYSVSLSYFVIRPKKALLLTWEKKALSYPILSVWGEGRESRDFTTFSCSDNAMFFSCFCDT